MQSYDINKSSRQAANLLLSELQQDTCPAQDKSTGLLARPLTWRQVAFKGPAAVCGDPSNQNAGCRIEGTWFLRLRRRLLRPCTRHRNQRADWVLLLCSNEANDFDRIDKPGPVSGQCRYHFLRCPAKVGGKSCPLANDHNVTPDLAGDRHQIIFLRQ